MQSGASSPMLFSDIEHPPKCKRKLDAPIVRGGPEAKKPCKFFMAGHCKFQPCKFLHSEKDRAVPNAANLQANVAAFSKSTHDKSFSKSPRAKAAFSNPVHAKESRARSAARSVACKAFEAGNCKYGSDCKFKHGAFKKQPCKYYEAGYCKNGSTCKFEHTKVQGEVAAVSSH